MPDTDFPLALWNQGQSLVTYKGNVSQQIDAYNPLPSNLDEEGSLNGLEMCHSCRETLPTVRSRARLMAALSTPEQ
jgi:hypothetical protein